jgi:hypothetical protein
VIEGALVHRLELFGSSALAEEIFQLAWRYIAAGRG